MASWRRSFWFIHTIKKYAKKIKHAISFRKCWKTYICTLCTCIFTTHTLSITAPFGKSNRKNCRRNGLGTCKGQRWHDSISSRTDGWALRWNWAFRLEKNVYKWGFWWLVAQGAPCKPNWDFRTILWDFLADNYLNVTLSWKEVRKCLANRGGFTYFVPVVT